MSDHMLPERQVFEVIRVRDNTFIEVHYTMKEALAAKADIEELFDDHECRIARAYIAGEETVEQRNKNEEV